MIEKAHELAARPLERRVRRRDDAAVRGGSDHLHARVGLSDARRTASVPASRRAVVGQDQLPSRVGLIAHRCDASLEPRRMRVEDGRDDADERRAGAGRDGERRGRRGRGGEQAPIPLVVFALRDGGRGAVQEAARPEQAQRSEAAARDLPRRVPAGERRQSFRDLDPGFHAVYLRELRPAAPRHAPSLAAPPTRSVAWLVAALAAPPASGRERACSARQLP